jgi:ParB/RepB/Spo0J family partition protein
VAELQTISLDRLQPHPDNPRLQLREDVIEQIAAEISRRGFGREHALLVRPMDDGYQIISGHHRHAAAQRAEVVAIPCWVREMDDREALMQLVLANTQGELSPLEIGWHALTAVPLGKRGRGNTGDGLTAYAAEIGKGQEYVSKLRAAAEVAREIHALGHEFNVADLLDKSKHLYEISKSHRDAWPRLTSAMLNGWSAADTAARVGELSKFKIPGRCHAWLPPAEVYERYLTSNYRFDPAKVERIIRAADGVYDWIDREAGNLDAEEFANWLIRNQGGEAWEPKKIDAWLAGLIGRVRERKLTPEIRAGNYEDVLADLPDASVDFILTDPPYGYEAADSYGKLAKFAARVLKPGGSLICYSGQAALPEIFATMTPHLRYWWMISLDHAHGRQQLPGKWVYIEWKPLLWFVKDERGGQDYVADQVSGSKPDKNAHEWAQGIDEVFYLIEQLSKPDDLIVDPFAGSGSFGKAALSLGRRFIGADLDPDSATGEIVA